MASISTKQSISVLIVDEQRTVVLGIKNMLADQPDIVFHACTDEREAVKMACKIRPSVILQDIYLPHIDGFELLKQYSKNEILRDIPVIMLSGEESAESKAEAFLDGADDYLVKPPHPVELIARIRHHSQVYFDYTERKRLLQILNEQKIALEEANQQLQRIATTDALTQIPNRLAFDKHFLQEWRLSVRNKTSFSVAMIDIDNFKQYNDHYGHQQGDTCLQKVATALSESVKRPSDMVARYGGEEFSVIFPSTPADGAQKIAERIRANIEALQIPHAHAEAAPHVTISMGIANAFPGDTDEHDTPDELLKAADAALYRAKKAGRNRVVVANKPDYACVENQRSASRAALQPSPAEVIA